MERGVQPPLYVKRLFGVNAAAGKNSFLNGEDQENDEFRQASW
jgi:hypothetical protein